MVVTHTAAPFPEYLRPPIAVAQSPRFSSIHSGNISPSSHLPEDQLQTTGTCALGRFFSVGKFNYPIVIRETNHTWKMPGKGIRGFSPVPVPSPRCSGCPRESALIMRMIILALCRTSPNRSTFHVTSHLVQKTTIENGWYQQHHLPEEET